MKEKNARAIDQSFRPLGYTPAFGRAVAPFGAVFTARVNACPSDGVLTSQAKLVALSKIGAKVCEFIKEV